MTSNTRILTPEREAKFKKVISARQPDVTVVFENIHDPHNISAILRSCDAIGILEVFIINTLAPGRKKLGKKSSASAKKWIDTHFYSTVEECIEIVKRKGYKVLATHLGHESKSLYELDLTQPIAFVFGNEKDIEDAIQNGVKETHRFGFGNEKEIEDTIKNGVKETLHYDHHCLREVVNIIKNGVKETKSPGADGDLLSTIEWMEENNTDNISELIEMRWYPLRSRHVVRKQRGIK